MTEKSDLIDEATSLGVDVRTSWTVDRLKVEIVKARRPQPQQAEQIDDPSDGERLRRFAALDSADRVGVAVGDDWSTGQIEEAVRVITEAANMAPPSVTDDGYAQGPNGAASPRG